MASSVVPEDVGITVAVKSLVDMILCDVITGVGLSEEKGGPLTLELTELCDVGYDVVTRLPMIEALMLMLIFTWLVESQRSAV